METQAAVPDVVVGLHVRIYFWVALFVAYAGVLLLSLIYFEDSTTPGYALLSSLAVLTIFHGSFYLARRRCDAPDLTCWNGLLLVARYATIGVGGTSLIFATFAALLATIAALIIALISLFVTSPDFAPATFRRLVIFAYSHRMYQ